MTRPRSLLVEILLFCALALLLALANAFLNPSAMALGKDYFPTSVNNGGLSPLPQGSDPNAPHASHEFQIADLAEMQADLEFFRAPEGDVLCLDARSPEHYRKGHIPGALLLDHYHSADYLPELLPKLQQAAMIIVYCAGGDCEDSIFLARDLVYTQGIDKEVLWIYEGGMTEWEAEGQALQEGMQP